MFISFLFRWYENRVQFYAASLTCSDNSHVSCARACIVSVEFSS